MATDFWASPPGRVVATIDTAKEGFSILRHVAISIFAVLLCTLPLRATSQPISGADDPALKAAAQAWLARDNEEEALWAIGLEAAHGNIAARIFANNIYYRFLRDDFPELTREELRRLFPLDMAIEQNRYRPYAVDRQAIAAFDALDRFGDAAEPEQQIALMAAALDAGLRESVLSSSFLITLGSDEEWYFDPEVISFAEQRFKGDQYDISGLWLIRAMLAGRHLRDIPGHISENGNPFWSIKQVEDVMAGVRAREWYALRAWAFLRKIDPHSFEDFEASDDLIRQADIIVRGLLLSNQNDKPTEVELEAVGAIAINNSENYDRLKPIVNLCQSYCGSHLNQCVAKMMLFGFDNIAPSFAEALEPVIPASDFFLSDRAVETTLRHSKIRANNHPNGIELPQCIQDAAE